MHLIHLNQGTLHAQSLWAIGDSRVNSKALPMLRHRQVFHTPRHLSLLDSHTQLLYHERWLKIERISDDA